MTDFLSLEDLELIAERYGIGPVRDVGLLASAALRPQTSVFGADAYESIDEKAAVLLESIVRNHPLVDGNKRLGWLAVTVFYDINGYQLEAPDDAAYAFVISVATGELPYAQSARILNGWSD